MQPIVQRAIVTLAGEDASQFSIQQVFYQGKAADAEIIFPYGMHANLAPDSIGLLFAVGNEEDNRAFIGGTPTLRPQLVEGEVVFYHPPTQTQIHFKANGDLDITVNDSGDDGGNVNIITAGDVNLTSEGAVSVTATDVLIEGNDGDVNLTASVAIALTAPVINLN